VQVVKEQFKKMCIFNKSYYTHEMPMVLFSKTTQILDRKPMIDPSKYSYLQKLIININLSL